jgi:hypothetical protein
MLGGTCASALATTPLIVRRTRGWPGQARRYCRSLVQTGCIKLPLCQTDGLGQLRSAQVRQTEIRAIHLRSSEIGPWA